MSNTYFQFKEFTIQQDRCAMKVTTDGCLFGAWIANELSRTTTTGKYLLDIGTGTGLLSLMIAQKTTANIDAVEIDLSAFAQASENARRSIWNDRIRVIHTDTRSLNPTKTYDYVVCNPPFYENELKSNDAQKNIAHHGDELSVAGLLPLLRQYLKAAGRCYLLLPFKRQAELLPLIRQYDLYIWQSVLVSPSPAHPFFRWMVEASTTEMPEVVERELVIRDQQQGYTPGFISLLKDYYLYL